MLTRSAVATASALCMLGWFFIFGLSADAQDGGTDVPTLLVIFGRAVDVIPAPSTGETVLQIDDGSRTWACSLGSLPAPETGAQVIAFCAFSPGRPPSIIRIAVL